MRQFWANRSLRAKAPLVLALPLAPLLVFGVFVIALALNERSAQRLVVRTLRSGAAAK